MIKPSKNIKGCSRNFIEKFAKELDFIDDVKHSGVSCVWYSFCFFMLIFFNFYTLLSVKSKHTQNGVFKNM